MNIIQQFSVKNDCYKANASVADLRYAQFQQRGPRGLMLHSVGCPQPNAKVFADSWNKANYQVAVHAVLQADGTVYQCMPWNYRGWHAGGSANNTHVGVEMTEPDCITYSGGRISCSNLSRAKEQVKGTYNTAADLFAMLCKKYSLDPLTDIISHAEGAKKGVASNHADPEHLWNGLGMGYTMDGFRKEVKRRMEDDMTEAEVRKIVNEAISKIDQRPPTRQEIMDATNDQWVDKFTSLPDWAKPEVRELIEMGAIKGTVAGVPVEETVINASVQCFIRPAIVAYRAVKALVGEAPKEVLADLLNKVLTEILDDGK